MSSLPPPPSDDPRRHSLVSVRRPHWAVLLCALLFGVSCSCAGGDPSASAPCGMEDLVVAARAVDLDAPAEALRTGRRLGLQGVVANPCSEPVVLTSPKICLAESFTLVDSSGKTRGGGTPCAESGGRWELPVQGARTVTFVLGSLPSGEYSAAVPFTFSGAEAAVDFQIGN